MVWLERIGRRGKGKGKTGKGEAKKKGQVGERERERQEVSKFSFFPFSPSLFTLFPFLYLFYYRRSRVYRENGGEGFVQGGEGVCI